MSYGELSNTQETMVLPMLQMKNIRGKPYITVSAKGMVNGLSNIPNDGSDFGPDTTKGATAPGQYGSPYTETSGIQDAQNYLAKKGYENLPMGGTIQLLDGVFEISTTINLTTPSLIIAGLGLATDRSTTIRLADGADVNIINVETSAFKCVIRNLAIDGNNANNTGSLYGIVANGNFTGQDLHINQIYLANVSGTAIYSNCGTYIEDVIVEGGTSWGLYLDGNAGWLVNGFLVYGGAGGVYIGSNGMTLSNITVYTATTPTLPQIEVAGNNNAITNVNVQNIFYQVLISGNSNNITGLQINAAITGSTPPTPIQITGLRNNINSVYLNIGEIDVTTYPGAIIAISSSGSVTKISSLFSNISLPPTFLVIQSAYNTISDVYANVSSASTAIADSGSNNKISNIYLYGPTTSTPLTLPSTDIVRDIFMIDGSTNTPVQLFTPTTPSVPSSATAQENTNPYAVDVYVYGGDVTKIQITKGGTAYTVFSVSTAIAMSGQAYKLNPGDSITVTYSTVPTWEWLSD